MPQNKVGRERRDPVALPGSAGYRTRSNRSGFDPSDTAAEQGRMEGLFWRNLFTLRLRTKNPFYLILLLVAALFFLWPIPLGIIDFAEKGRLLLLCGVLLFAIPGFLLLANFILSLFPAKPKNRKTKSD